MHSLIGRIALVTYILGGMIVPSVHSHSGLASAHVDCTAELAGRAQLQEDGLVECCGQECFSDANQHRASTDSASEDHASVDRAGHSDDRHFEENHQCHDNCVVCQFLSSAKTPTYPSLRYEFESVVIDSVALYDVELDQASPYYQFAPRGPPKTVIA